MDQLKTGKFIADCRKRKNLTQMQLAEKLGITDKAVANQHFARGRNPAGNFCNFTVNSIDKS